MYDLVLHQIKIDTSNAYKHLETKPLRREAIINFHVNALIPFDFNNIHWMVLLVVEQLFGWQWHNHLRAQIRYAFNLKANE